MSKQYMKLFTLQNIYMPPIEQLPICELPATFDIQKYSLKCKCSKETTAPVSLQHKGEIPYCLNTCIHQQDSAVLHRACTDGAKLPTSPSLKLQSFNTHPLKNQKI